MPRKVMIFAGAPEDRTLDWTGPNLLNHFLDSIASFAHLDTSTSASPESSTREISFLSTPDPAVWRSIPLHHKPLRTGFSQTHTIAHPYQGAPEFFTTLSASYDTTSGLSQDKLGQSIIDQFYDHSLAIHEELTSSQLPPQSLSTDDSSLDVTEDVSLATTIQEPGATVGHHNIPGNEVRHLSDLGNLPDASYLLKIAPQTMTVNLIVGIISIAEPRTVQTRWGTTQSLVELLVGDETKSGFSVTFWMSSEASEINTLVRSLRRQDVVLLRNVALGVFMKKVHGHSLRKSYTKVDLLHRRRIEKDDIGGIYSMKDISSTETAHPQLMKARKVREWLIHFVGDGGASLGKRRHDGKPIRRWDLPPADTP
ncbi:hypothetical protein GGS21DRAFT_248286 [Xylaria nigripes]|nr:hypothetical protein GGS21DRAFT_248286 [Xylaria nigripes]